MSMGKKSWDHNFQNTIGFVLLRPAIKMIENKEWSLMIYTLHYDLNEIYLLVVNLLHYTNYECFK